MEVFECEIAGLLLFKPTPHRDDRGFFTRTFETELFDRVMARQADAGALAVRAADFIEDSQSRSQRGVVRGMHGRSGGGEAKLVRCARGSIDDVVVDLRPSSPTRGQHLHFRLDDRDHHHLFIPPGFLHGFQALTDADVCYRINRTHDASEDIAVHYLDPDLGIEWSMPAGTMSARDRSAGPLSALW